MIGSIIGDMIGRPYEAKGWTGDGDPPLWIPAPDDHPRCEGGLSPIGRFAVPFSVWSDDTVMTCAVAQAVLRVQADGHDLACLDPTIFQAYCASQYVTWGRRYGDCGFGRMFKTWLETSTPESPAPSYQSYGNGAPMRVGPLGWCDADAIDRMVPASCMPTHDHPDAVHAAWIIARAIHDARSLRGSQMGAQVKAGLLLEHARKRHADARQAIPTLTPYAWNRVRFEAFDVSAAGCVPVVLEILTRASSFDDLMRRVIGAGGDTDTVGSMAGAIWEALDGIPLTWVDLVTPLLPMAVMDTVTAYHERMHA